MFELPSGAFEKHSVSGIRKLRYSGLVSGSSLWLYRAALRGGLGVAAPVLWVRDRASGKARPPLAHRFGRDVPTVKPGGFWIQAVSVGEVEIARRLIRELDIAAPGLPVFLTATTATGLALARKTAGGRVVVHPCPLDLGRPLRRVLNSVRPSLLLLVETEIWPEMLHQTAARNIPAVIANARLSEQSFGRYLRVRSLLRPLLEPVRMVLARSEADAERFAALGIPEDRLQVTGNVKYDLVPNTDPLPWASQLSEWSSGRPIFVAGSTMEGEEEIILRALDRLPEALRPFLVLAPRHPERFGDVAHLLEDRGLTVARRSALDAAPATPDCFLLDTIGELSRAYRGAAAAFIGGSLVPTGGHNPLEPAVWATPVLSGPHVHNFQEVYAEMTAGGGAVIVGDSETLADTLRRWLEDPGVARSAGEAGRSVIEANRGATRKIVDTLLDLIGYRGRGATL